LSGFCVWETGLRSVAAADLSFSSVSAATGVIRFARSCFPSAVLCFWARAPVHSRAGASVAREEIFLLLILGFGAASAQQDFF
jgi:hypothetical protein